ncbi:hypothetical protein DFH08DRAFT_1076412 [Mycena albidolilacea]|uniref:Uncharacterized protein n=1 Tax=Mycena albidolilacea TaxID=1033008 RepID=A0AAD7ACM4_9AGAR|nr:hypothetical protein DFH08DRAFT_1076411 [Mycena albidolilacea]KAJ7355255.1 hypothetical protein DFH08DRAFT_1076412 [Mycena albidolilacea]
MLSTFTTLAAFVSAAAAVVVCPLEQFSGLSFVATFQNGARWDVLTSSVGNGHVGDVGWIVNAGPNVNEVFTAHTAGAPGHFTLTRKNAQDIDVTGNNNGASLLATTGRQAIWNIVCSDCPVATGPNQGVGSNCGIQLLANGALTNLCVNFQTDNVVRVLTCNNNNANQNIHIFSA